MKKPAYMPPGYQNLIPSLSFNGTDRALDWYKKVFGAEERMRMDGPDQKILHAELNIGDSMFFLAEENPQYGALSAKGTNGNSISLHLYVKDVDKIVKKAVENGASLTMGTMDMFYGDRVGCIHDPFGYTWVVATHIKDVTDEEMRAKSLRYEPVEPA